MRTWTLLSNQGIVLLLIARHSKITAAEMASQLGMTERSIRRIIDDLENAGYISKVKEGRENVYTVNLNSSLRHPQMRDVKVKELLEPFGIQTGKRAKTRDSIKKAVKSVQ